MLMTGSNRASVWASVWRRWLFTDVEWSWWSLWKSAAHRPASHCWWWILALFTYLLLLVQTMNVSISCMLCLVRETRTEIDRADRGSYNEWELLSMRVNMMSVCLIQGAAVFFPNKEVRRRQLFQLVTDMNVCTSHVVYLSLFLCAKEK